MDLGFEHLDNGLGVDQLRQADQGAEHTDVENDRPADLLHHRLIHRQFYLPRIHLFAHFDVTAVGDEQTAGTKDGKVIRVGLLRQTDQHIGLEHFWKVDWGLGDNDVGAGRAASRFRTIGLGLNGDQIFMQYGGLRQNDRRRDHPLAA